MNQLSFRTVQLLKMTSVLWKIFMSLAKNWLEMVVKRTFRPVANFGDQSLLTWFVQFSQMIFVLEFTCFSSLLTHKSHWHFSPKLGSFPYPRGTGLKNHNYNPYDWSRTSFINQIFSRFKKNHAKQYDFWIFQLCSNLIE